MYNQFLGASEFTKARNGRSARAPGVVRRAGPAWAQSLAADTRVLVVLIENGGIDLGIPEVVGDLLDAVPGGGAVPDSVKQALVKAVRDKLKAVTDNLLESAELAVNRNAANGKPVPLRSVYMMNCVGSSLNQAWLDAGAKASAGALRNNYLPEPTT